MKARPGRAIRRFAKRRQHLTSTKSLKRLTAAPSLAGCSKTGVRPSSRAPCLPCRRLRAQRRGRPDARWSGCWHSTTANPREPAEANTAQIERPKESIESWSSASTIACAVWAARLSGDTRNGKHRGNAPPGMIVGFAHHRIAAKGRHFVTSLTAPAAASGTKPVLRYARLTVVPAESGAARSSVPGLAARVTWPPSRPPSVEL